MGYYAEYLDRNLDHKQLTQERKNQLAKISALRKGRDVLVYAADLNKNSPPFSSLIPISYADLLPINDQVANLKGRNVDLILETPGGSGEVAEDIVRLLHGRFRSVAVIVPGWAKSAGTLIAMAGDEILMEPSSALGPIDAQLHWQGKVFSAEAFLEGFEKIKQEVADTGSLNKAYIPILQAISPGEIVSARNALDFARRVVADWLVTYKFKNWKKHRRSGNPVTPAERTALAEAIADKLKEHKYWLTHARSIKMDDLRSMGLRVTDYSRSASLCEAIKRYHTLLQMTFATNIYKVFETPMSQIVRFSAPVVAGPGAQVANAAMIEVKCEKCQAASKIQANLDQPQALQQGCLPFPADNQFRCPGCGSTIDLADARRQIELQSKKRVVA